MNKPTLFDFIFDIVRKIPEGRVTSYGAIAKCIGSATSARIVGWALNAAHQYPDVPAHRVVNSKGLLTGKHHFGQPDEMQKRLESEGVIVTNDCVQNFKQVFWDPITLLNE